MANHYYQADVPVAAIYNVSTMDQLNAALVYHEYPPSTITTERSSTISNSNSSAWSTIENITTSTNHCMYRLIYERYANGSSSTTITDYVYRYPIVRPIIRIAADIDVLESDGDEYRWRFPGCARDYSSKPTQFRYSSSTYVGNYTYLLDNLQHYEYPIIDLQGHTIRNTVLGGTGGMFQNITGTLGQTFSPTTTNQLSSSSSTGTYSQYGYWTSSYSKTTNRYSLTSLPTYRESVYAGGIYNGNIVGVYDGNGGIFKNCTFYNCSISVDVSTAMGTKPFENCMFYNCSIYIKDEGHFNKHSYFYGCGGTCVDIYFNCLANNSTYLFYATNSKTDRPATSLNVPGTWHRTRVWGYATQHATGSATFIDSVWGVTGTFEQDWCIADRESTGVYNKDLMLFGLTQTDSETNEELHSLIPCSSDEIKSSVELRKKGFVVDQLA